MNKKIIRSLMVIFILFNCIMVSFALVSCTNSSQDRTTTIIASKDKNNNNGVKLLPQKEKIKVDKEVNKIYPIGSLYFTTSKEDPAKIFGGKWKKIEDKFILSSGKRNVGETGGEETTDIREENLPNGSITQGTKEEHDFSANKTGTIYFNKNKDQKEINNMPPYLVVNVYERIE